MRIKEKLRSERVASEQRWREFIRSKDTRLITSQASWLAQSWQMSEINVSVNKTSAPLEDPDSVRAQFMDSHFYQAANPVLQDLEQALADTGFAIGLSDAHAQLQWTYTSRAMARKLESVHFLPSARWDEASIGTNAVGLSARMVRPVTVFSAEHYIPNLHEWVCYAAPIVHASTGQVMAVLDMSAPWQNSTPLALATVSHYASRISQVWSQLDIQKRTAFYFCSRTVPLSSDMQLPRRLQEIFLVLALHPEGLSLERLHALVYGDASVSISTLKSEMTHLRAHLGDALQARPYRIVLAIVLTDAQLIESYVHSGRLKEAVTLYQRPLLVQSESPAVCEYREYLHCLVVDALSRCTDVEAMWQFVQVHEPEYAVLNQLSQVLALQDTRLSAVRAKLALLL